MTAPHVARKSLLPSGHSTQRCSYTQKIARCDVSIIATTKTSVSWPVAPVVRYTCSNSSGEKYNVVHVACDI